MLREQNFVTFPFHAPLHSVIFCTSWRGKQTKAKRLKYGSRVSLLQSDNLLNISK